MSYTSSAIELAFTKNLFARESRQQDRAEAQVFSPSPDGRIGGVPDAAGRVRNRAVPL